LEIQTARRPDKLAKQARVRKRIRKGKNEEKQAVSADIRCGKIP
jgi:hypothetical protein